MVERGIERGDEERNKDKEEENNIKLTDFLVCVGLAVSQANDCF